IPGVSPAAGANDDLLARIASHIAPLQKDSVRISKVATSEQTLDYITRLQDDSDLLTISPVPYGYSAEEFADTVRTTARLDLSLADQLIAGKRLPIDAAPGIQARFVVSSADGSWQPVAVFVPQSYGPS